MGIVTVRHGCTSHALSWPAHWLLLFLLQPLGAATAPSLMTHNTWCTLPLPMPSRPSCLVSQGSTMAATCTCNLTTRCKELSWHTLFQSTHLTLYCRQPDLCYEWFCAKAGSPLPYTEVAKEYAHFFVATVDAIRSLNDDRIKVQSAARASLACCLNSLCGLCLCPC